IGKLLILAIAVDSGKVRRRLAYADSEGRCHQCHEKAQAESRIADSFHGFSSLRSNIMHPTSSVRHGRSFATGAGLLRAHSGDKPLLREEPERREGQQWA